MRLVCIACLVCIERVGCIVRIVCIASFVRVLCVLLLQASDQFVEVAAMVPKTELEEAINDIPGVVDAMVPKTDKNEVEEAVDGIPGVVDAVVPKTEKKELEEAVDGIPGVVEALLVGALCASLVLKSIACLVRSACIVCIVSVCVCVSACAPHCVQASEASEPHVKVECSDLRAECLMRGSVLSKILFDGGYASTCPLASVILNRVVCCACCVLGMVCILEQVEWFRP